MSFFTTWFVVFSVGLLAVMSPGPDFVLTIRNSLVYSRRAGIYTGLRRDVASKVPRLLKKSFSVKLLGILTGQGELAHIR